MQSDVTDFQFDRDSLQKNIYFSKLKLLKSVYCLGWNVLLKEFVYLMIHTSNYFIIPMSKTSYSDFY